MPIVGAVQAATDRLVPPRVTPPAKPLRGLSFLAAFVRNPISVVPQAAYEADFAGYEPGGRRIAWITAPDMIRQVLLDEREKFQKLSQIRLLSPLLGKGVLTSEGADWKWQRQAVAPMFRHQDLMSFVPAFVRAAQDTVARWRARPGVQAVDHDMTQATFDVITGTLLPSADSAMPQAVERSTAEFQRAGAWGQLYAVANFPKWMPQPGRRMLAHSVRTLRGAVGRVIAERRAHRAAPDDLLGRLMAARDPETGQAMNDEQLVDNLLTFYLAGHETTAKGLTWTLYLLARAPEWSAVLEEEAARVTGGGDVQAAHIEKLVLTQQVLKESMRLFPPVPIITRQAIADTTLGGHPVRAGTAVVMPIYAIHRHAGRWEDPDAFDPARFSPEREAGIPRYQYMPFGAGPRICIGQAFAMLEATAMLATFVAKARFAQVDGHAPEPVARVTLVPRGGMPLAVRLKS
jgi:cytochrome P450